MLRHRVRSIVLSLAVLFAVSVYGESFSGKVVSVTDGDTIQVMRDGRATKIRLHGIDCPESHQDFGTQAKKLTSDLAFGKMVSVEVEDIDRYGRIVGDVWLPDGTNLNQALVRSGMAWWYQQYAPGDKTLKRAEQSARQARRGLWSRDDAIPPWEFRRGARPGGEARIDSGTNQGTSPTVTSETTSETVYRTKTGEKYHRAGCRYLSKSSFPIPLDDARQRYSPCSVCSPPR
jgi:endonuclease YncB( thermonuclease family)